MCGCAVPIYVWLLSDSISRLLAPGSTPEAASSGMGGDVLHLIDVLWVIWIPFWYVVWYRRRCAASNWCTLRYLDPIPVCGVISKEMCCIGLMYFEVSGSHSGIWCDMGGDVLHLIDVLWFWGIWIPFWYVRLRSPNQCLTTKRFYIAPASSRFHVWSSEQWYGRRRAYSERCDHEDRIQLG